MGVKFKGFTLDDGTLNLLERMRSYSERPGSQIVRWAVRQYALAGAWFSGTDAERAELLQVSITEIRTAKAGR